jgi:hypothetical protein
MSKKVSTQNRKTTYKRIRISLYVYASVDGSEKERPNFEHNFSQVTKSIIFYATIYLRRRRSAHKTRTFNIMYS